VLDVKFTDLGIEIRARDEIDAGLKEAEVDCAYQPGDPRRYDWYVDWMTSHVGSQIESFMTGFRRTFLYSGYSQSHIRKIERERLRRSSAINTSDQ
jgi:hypothetical protein